MWKNDYLSQLQKRQKWTKEQPNLKVGRLVLLKDQDKHSCEWPMGIIVKVYPGNDGRVRVAEVKTAHGRACFKRAISKLVPLPVDVSPEPLPGSAGGVC